MTIEIVAGQVLDLQFESRSDVMPDEYLEMISGKTAAIVEYAARSGAIVAGAATDTAARFAEFGRAVGIGFQVQDDLLGIWGESSETGKAKSDDIRRKKKSLPILLLRAAASPAQLDELDRIYVQETVSPEGVERVLELLAGLGIRTAVESHVRKYHDRATAALDLACDGSHHAAGEQLRQLVQRLATRTA
jgi:geranylgeranyl diphosphate synthase type I